jgi:site-specific DNA-cytosine methylase
MHDVENQNPVLQHLVNGEIRQSWDGQLPRVLHAAVASAIRHVPADCGRDRRLHVAGTGARASSRLSQRFVVVRSGPLRNGCRRAALDGSEILVSRGKEKNPRRLTPRECARLMGYPATFKITVSDTQAYEQFGNSVVVPVIRAVAQIMEPHIRTLQRYEETGVLEMPLFG